MDTESKILSLEALAEKSRALRAAGRSVVLCHGVFDLLHPGHLRHLRQARGEGDVLMVTLTADRFVSKGPGRPVFTEVLRAESLAALACVDHVAIHHGGTAVEIIDRVRPDVYVKGPDYKKEETDITGNIARERQAVEAHGGRIFHTDDITFSSTSLLNDHFEVFPPATKAYLKEFKEQHDADGLVSLVQSFKKTRVLVVGESIVDEYCYATPMGLTGKSGNILAAKFESVEQFAGGALAVANHLSGFVDEVTILSGLGKTNSHESFIRSRLAPNVKPVFYYFDSAPTLVKRRFVDSVMDKLFEIYYYDEVPLSEKTEAAFRSWIDSHTADYDLVVVPDYGNGLISKGMVDSLCRHARFLAINTQINSGNWGHHVVTRYPRADFISLNVPELRLAAHNRHEAIEIIMAHIGGRLGVQQFAVTRGMNGATMLDGLKHRFHKAPALSTTVVDRIGAGDAFFAFSALAAGNGQPPEMTLFLGNVAAALDVRIVCNREPVSRVALCKYITTLLK